MSNNKRMRYYYASSSDGSCYHIDDDEDSVLLQHEQMQRELEAEKDQIDDAMLELPDDEEEAFSWMKSRYGADNSFDRGVFYSAMDREDFVRMVITSNWRVIQFVPSDNLDDTAKLIAVIKSKGTVVNFLTELIEEKKNTPNVPEDDIQNLVILQDDMACEVVTDREIAVLFNGGLDVVATEAITLDDFFWFLSKYGLIALTTEFHIN